MVQDYWYLNQWTVKNNYLLPLILQLIDWLKGASLFTKMDLWLEYNNIQIKEGNKWKGAFICHQGTFVPLIIYFRQCNSPAMFQAIMNDIFADMQEIVIVYIDNILVFTKIDDEKEHVHIILKVL